MHRRTHRLRLAPLAAAILIISLGCAVLGSPQTPAAPTDTVQVTETTPEPAATEPLAETADVSPTEAPADEARETAPSADLAAVFEPFWQSWGLLHRYFVDQPLDGASMVQGAITGLSDHDESPPAEVSDETAEAFADAAGTPNDLAALFVPFWKTWAGGSGDDTARMRAALNGMIVSLGDEHTSYMDPDQFFQANIPIDGTYEGIGAWVDTTTEYLTIVSPMPDSPAETAGLRPGDQVIQVDGDDMTGIDGNLVIRRVLGPAGTEVTLTIRREGGEDFDVTIIRAKITVPSLSGEILADSNLAYVQLFSFGETTGDELHSLLEELLAQEPDGLIFDLRSNGGGLLSTAIEVASEFIADGVIVTEQYGDGSSDVFESLGGGAATEIPLVVLINEGSASASEIVAGAIQDYGRATLVGTTSFGKGSVQNWLSLPDDGAIRITIARWYTPNDRLIHDIGLIPDVAVELTEEDFNAGLDPQLDAAIELLTQN